jgi:hypothetical protein
MPHISNQNNDSIKVNYVNFSGVSKPNFDLNPMWTFYIPFSKIFVPVIALGIGFSFHTISLINNEGASDNMFIIFSDRFIFLFNLNANVGFDIHWNQHGAVRFLANFSYTTNPYKYLDYEYKKPWFSFSLGLYFKF